MLKNITSISLSVGDEFTHCVHFGTRIRVESFVAEESSGDVLVVYRILEGRCVGLVKARPLGEFMGIKFNAKSELGSTFSARRYEKIAPLDSAPTKE